LIFLFIGGTWDNLYGLGMELKEHLIHYKRDLKARQSDFVASGRWYWSVSRQCQHAFFQNPKFDTRNSTQIRNVTDGKLQNWLAMRTLNVFEFGFRVCFEFRISDFEFWDPRVGGTVETRPEFSLCACGGRGLWLAQ
jgi:hypothetical protein